MILGQVEAIYTAAEAGSPMRRRGRVEAVPGRGLEGDRYCAGNGAFSTKRSPGREVTELTLIEAEVIEPLRHDVQLDVDAADSRRNIVTRGIALNDLVGTDFWVGDVHLHAAGLCEPCVSLVKSPENKHLLRGLAHRGGLRARILSGGTITVGDTIELTSVISTRRGSTRKGARRGEHAALTA